MGFSVGKFLTGLGKGAIGAATMNPALTTSGFLTTASSFIGIRKKQEAAQSNPSLYNQISFIKGISSPGLDSADRARIAAKAVPTFRLTSLTNTVKANIINAAKTAALRIPDLDINPALLNPDLKRIDFEKAAEMAGNTTKTKLGTIINDIFGGGGGPRGGVEFGQETPRSFFTNVLVILAIVAILIFGGNLIFKSKKRR